MPVRVAINATAIAVQLFAKEKLVNVYGPQIILADPDNRWFLSLPRDAFAGMSTDDGDSIITTISLVKVKTFEEPEPLVTIPSALSWPKAN